MFFFKDFAENEVGKLVPDCFLFFKKALYQIKANGLQLDFIYILIALKLAYNRNKLLKTLQYWSRDMLKFEFLEKSLGIVSPAHFVHNFSTKMFLISYSINWPNFIAWLPLLLEILGNMCIGIVCYPGCDVMDFEINLILIMEPFFLQEQKELLRWNKKPFSLF